MAEHADMMINGLLCQQCGVFIDGLEPGFPRTCGGCDAPDTPSHNKRNNRNKKKRKKSKVPKFKFSLGQVLVTSGINGVIAVEKPFQKLVNASLSRHHRGDWGDCSEEDARANDHALKDGSRIFSVYHLPDDLKWVSREEKIWIITEADRSATMVLWPSEY